MVVDGFEVILRVTSALALTVAAIYIIVQTRNGSLRPYPIWLYVGCVTGVLALWRWVIVALLRAELWPNVATQVSQWIQPINQSLYTVMGVSLLTLAYVSVRTRHTDE
jgi:hypothetical protein